MGVDISGLAPTGNGPCGGKYISVSWWHWRPLLALVRIASDRNCSSGGMPLVEDGAFRQMQGSEGAGLPNAEACNRLAHGIEEILDAPSLIAESGLVLDDEIISFPVDRSFCVNRVTSSLMIDRAGELEGVDPGDLRSPYAISTSYARSFCEFLRNCGGFEVW